MSESIAEYLQSRGIDEVSARGLSDSCVTNGQFNFMVYTHAYITGNLNESYMNSVLGLAGLKSDPDSNFNAKFGDINFDAPANFVGEGPVSWGEMYKKSLNPLGGGSPLIVQDVLKGMRQQDINIMGIIFGRQRLDGLTAACAEMLLSNSDHIMEVPHGEEPIGYNVLSPASSSSGISRS